MQQHEVLSWKGMNIIKVSIVTFFISVTAIVVGSSFKIDWLTQLFRYLPYASGLTVLLGVYLLYRAGKAVLADIQNLAQLIARLNKQVPRRSPDWALELAQHLLKDKVFKARYAKARTPVELAYALRQANTAFVNQRDYLRWRTSIAVALDSALRAPQP